LERRTLDGSERIARTASGTRLTRDGWLLLASRITRLFAYGALSIVLVLYLSNAGLSEPRIGALLTLTLLGDVAISLYLTTRADRLGRRRMLVLGSLLMIGAGVVFAATGNFWLLLLAGTIGVISPSGNEVGPFLPIEQAALAQVVDNRRRTQVFAWYTLAGAFATALGSLAGGLIPQTMETLKAGGSSPYRSVIILYAVMGIVLALLFSRLSPAAEVSASPANHFSAATRFLGIHRGKSIVLKLSVLFALDSFGGGFVVQSFAAYWFHLRFGADAASLGSIFFGANILAGVSALVASRLARRFGLVKTMVFTHLPSNILLVLVPLMPALPLAVLVLFLRFSISQMDVPTRQSYMMAVVAPDERSAAAGISGVAKTIGASLAPVFVGLIFARPQLVNLPFFIAGTLKIAYDLLLYRGFVAIRPPEETA
jgi:MFS family permease